MVDLLNDCDFVRVTSSVDISNFDCGEPRLNEFLKKNAIDYKAGLLAVSWVFVLSSDPKEIVAFFSVSNDAIHVKELPPNCKNRINKKVDSAKHRNGYPAVKVGQLAVDKKYRGANPKVGSQLMRFIKGFFISDNKTGCKFVLVDATNKEKVLNYYQTEGFEYLFKDEDAEASFEKRPKPMKTRAMFYDLGKLI